MRTVVAVPPEPVVTWADADVHLRLDGDDSQRAYVESLVAAATAHLDGPHGVLRRAVGLQTLELRTCGFPRAALSLPFGPVGEVESITYLDAGGDEQTLAASAWTLAGDVLRLAHGQAWPAVRGDAECVRIRYTAGWAAEALPAPLKAAILMLTAHWFRHREAVAVGGQVTDLPLGFDALITPYRILRV